MDMSGSSATIIAAIITALGAIVVALITTSRAKKQEEPGAGESSLADTVVQQATSARNRGCTVTIMLSVVVIFGALVYGQLSGPQNLADQSVTPTTMMMFRDDLLTPEVQATLSSIWLQGPEASPVASPHPLGTPSTE